MKLSYLEIKNFRNFEYVEIELDNKNVIFGMNDVGKTNFLYAIRYLLDRETRRYNFNATDYHKYNTKEAIEILLTIDLSDFKDSDDTKKLVSQIKGDRTSEKGDVFYIKLESEFDEKELIGLPVLKWGDDKDNLKEIPFAGLNPVIDNVFQIVYINPLIDMEQVFEKSKRYVFNDKNKDEDKDLIRKIDDLTKQVNDNIGKMTTISSFQTDITREYKKLKEEDIVIEMKSEVAVNGFFSDIKPYMKKNGEENYYPTSGDGRRKVLAYSLFNLLCRKRYENKIVIYLIEEPENNLHRSMQIALSKQLFDEEIYKYLFISTHSSNILYEMHRTRLIRIYSKSGIECLSYLYNILPEYNKNRKKLNRDLTNALFSEKVLLIEGPSERVLFEKVLLEVNSKYELAGGFMLEVLGIGFKPYIDVLRGLDIVVIIKTDNDIRCKKGTYNEYELLGINRCLEIIKENKMSNIIVDIKKNAQEKTKIKKLKRYKLKIYKQYPDIINRLRNDNIYLSEIDLEHDLYKVIGNRMKLILQKETEEKTIDYLQDKKLINMVELVNGLEKEDCENIYNSYEFACLRELGIIGR